MSVVDIVCFCVCRDLQTLVIFSFFRSGFTVNFKIMIRSPIETTGKDKSYASDSGDVNSHQVVHFGPDRQACYFFLLLFGQEFVLIVVHIHRYY